MASCADASFDESAALYQGAVNVDLERLARQLISSTITPEKYHHRVRDRVRKARKAKRDPALRLAWLVGDTDKDLIPNSLDLCPTTPDFEPTDDRGCPRAPPALAYVPNAEVVQQLFTKMGAAGDPKCAGAPVPSTPSAALLRLTGNGPLTPPTSLGGSPQQTTYHLAHIIKLGRVSNQPPGCLLMYDVEIVSRSSSPLQQHAYQFRYRDSEATYSDATSLSFWPRPGATGQHAALLADLTANWTASIRVRAVNGNGQASGWSPAY